MKRLQKYFFSFFLIPLLLSTSSNNKSAYSDSVNFPVPPKSEELLFYLQRTINSNTVVYETNRKTNGEINIDEPIKIHWIQYAKDSTCEPLNYIQKNFAYGVNTKLFDAAKKSFVFHFVSYKEKPLYLLRSTIDNKYHVYTSINNKLSILDKIFVQIDGGTFWVPEISFVEITGSAPPPAGKLTEKIKP